MAYPAVADVGLRVARLGRSSVAYELALFERGAPDAEGPRAVCHFVHVFVERKTGRPPPAGMAAELRRGLERICTAAPGAASSSKM